MTRNLTEQLLSDEPDTETEVEEVETEEVEIEDDEIDAEEVDPEEEVEESTEEEGEEPEAEPEETAAEKEPKQVPLAELMTERRKRQNLEQRLNQLEQSLTQKGQQEEAPDPLEKPKEFNTFIQKRIEEQNSITRMQISEHYAKKTHGEEVVMDALEALKEAPESDRPAGLATSIDPFGELVEWHKTYQKKAETKALLSDPEEFIKKIREEIRAELLADNGKSEEAKSGPAQQKPPASLAKKTSTKASTKPEPVELSTKQLFGVIK
jgi:hypothetical protein